LGENYSVQQQIYNDFSSEAKLGMEIEIIHNYPINADIFNFKVAKPGC